MQININWLAFVALVEVAILAALAIEHNNAVFGFMAGFVAPECLRGIITITRINDENDD